LSKINVNLNIFKTENNNKHKCFTSKSEEPFLTEFHDLYICDTSIIVIYCAAQMLTVAQGLECGFCCESSEVSVRPHRIMMGVQKTRTKLGAFRI